MASYGSLEKQIKIEPGEDGEPCFSGNVGDYLLTTIKTEDEEISLPSETPELSECNIIKTEEVSIYSELPAEENDSSMHHISDETKILFRCYLCATVTHFEDNEALRSHLLTSHPLQKKYRCEDCDQQNVTIETYNRHRQQHDPSIRPYKCDVCTLRFINLDMKKQHEADVHELNNGRKKRVRKRRRTTCPVCFKTVFTDTLEQHLHSEHQNARMSCPFCGEQFYSKNKLKLHIAVHKRENKLLGGNKCNLCESDNSFTSKELLQQHLNEFHPWQSEYQCEECGYSAKDITNLNNHLSKHDVLKKPFKCTMCESRFTRTRYRRDHETLIHKIDHNKLHYDCPVCKKEFPNTKERNRHVKQHSCKCYICNIELENAAALKLHLNNHIDSLYQCNECDYATPRASSFNKHHTSHDASTNPYKCNFCTLRFTEDKFKIIHEASKHGQSLQPRKRKSNAIVATSEHQSF